MDFIDSVSVEIIEMVFLRLTNSEILKATLLNPKVNNIISNALLLTRKFCKIQRDQPIQGTRKYTKTDFFDLERLPPFQVQILT